MEIPTEKLKSISDRIKRADELLGSISYISTGQGLRAREVWDEVAKILGSLRNEEVIKS